MNEITYTMVGDYNLPNLTLPQQSEVTLGKWSRMRRTYLKQHHKILYYNLLTKGTLTQHLAEVQQRATELEETLVKQMAQKEGLTEQMKHVADRRGTNAERGGAELLLDVERHGKNLPESQEFSYRHRL